MHTHRDPNAMTAEERLREVASILAAGILRLHAHAALPTDQVEASGFKSPPESGDVSLEVGEETVLSVHTG